MPVVRALYCLFSVLLHFRSFFSRPMKIQGQSPKTTKPIQAALLLSRSRSVIFAAQGSLDGLTSYALLVKMTDVDSIENDDSD